MDIVITYVDGRDPAWQQDYETYTSIPALTKRFRDWGTLRYLLRGIEANMPFIRNVYLVVSHPSQVPEWVDASRLKVVLHKDIIPAGFLPVFNSTAIEMFLHRIPGLDEQYIYFNDDMFPIGRCSADDFFRDGKIVIGFARHLLVQGMYKRQCRNSDRLARKALGMKSSPIFIRPQHICSPMLKSECAELYALMEKEIHASVSRLREDKNLNQYLFLDYIYHKGKAIAEKISNKHFSVAIASAASISSFIACPHRKMACINDVHLNEQKFQSMKSIIGEAFEHRFPDKSKYEK